jgi:hypothetical protein
MQMLPNALSTATGTLDSGQAPAGQTCSFSEFLELLDPDYLDDSTGPPPSFSCACVCQVSGRGGGDGGGGDGGGAAGGGAGGSSGGGSSSGPCSSSQQSSTTQTGQRASSATLADQVTVLEATGGLYT